MQTILRVEGISKRFPGVQAVDRVTFDLYRGEIMALVGENGAGKSTLMRVLGGVEQPEEGRVILEGEEVNFRTPHQAMEAGVSMVFQELSLVNSLSIAENIFANRQPVGRLNNIRWRSLHRQTREFLGRFDLDLEPATPVKRLSMGQQQILEILKAISTGPKVLILDEPTSSLTEAETAYLFQNIRKLQAGGMSFVYITHKLSEVFELAGRVMVMRDGRHVATRPVGEVREQDVVAMMVGREIEDMYGATEEADAAAGRPGGPPFFRVEGLGRRGRFQDITFDLQRGEILGMAGLIGAGRTDVARAIFGVDPRDRGRILLEGQELTIRRPQDAIEHGIAYLTEDRKSQGLFLEMSLRENLVAPSLRQFTDRLGFLVRSKISANAVRSVRAFDIATPSISQKILNLSGGNQQKSMIAMWTGIQPQVILFDEPTRGVDVGARSDIYHKLREFAHAGTGIVMISSDLPELIGMCDRILVMHQGTISGQVERSHFSEELILALAAGLEPESASSSPDSSRPTTA
jgi:ABC-type sugar transport system ATPase subunit